jgi:hypothetical protein
MNMASWPVASFKSVDAKDAKKKREDAKERQGRERTRLLQLLALVRAFLAAHSTQHSAPFFVCIM